MHIARTPVGPIRSKLEGSMFRSNFDKDCCSGCNRMETLTRRAFASVRSCKICVGVIIIIIIVVIVHIYISLKIKFFLHFTSNLLNMISGNMLFQIILELIWRSKWNFLLNVPLHWSQLKDFLPVGSACCSKMRHFRFLMSANFFLHCIHSILDKSPSCSLWTWRWWHNKWYFLYTRTSCHSWAIE